MRKMFRMKYEKCSGQCYAPSDVMRIHTLGLDVEGAVVFLKRLLAMHAPACGNDSLQFRLDADEWEESFSDWKPIPKVRFIASFWHYGTLDLFSGATPLEALNKMIDAALDYYQSAEFKEHPNYELDRHNVCHHGTDDKLVSFALAFSGLSPQDQEAVRSRL